MPALSLERRPCCFYDVEDRGAYWSSGSDVGKSRPPSRLGTFPARLALDATRRIAESQVSLTHKVNVVIQKPLRFPPET